MEEHSKIAEIGEQPIYDASVLGMPTMLALGIQHMFAMFGAIDHITVCRYRHTSFSSYFKEKSSRIFRFIICISGRIRSYSSKWGKRAAPLRMFRSSCGGGGDY